MKKSVQIVSMVLFIIAATANICLYVMNGDWADDFTAIQNDIGLVNVSISQKTEEIAALGEAVATAQGELLALRDELTTQEDNINEARESIAETEAAILALNDDIADKEAAILDYQKQMAVSEDEIDSAEAQIRELERTVTTLSRPKPTPTPPPKQSTETPAPSTETPPLPPPPATTSTDVHAFAAEVVRLTNVERQNHGLSALSSGNSSLNSAAGIRAQEIVSHFSHTRPDGSSCFTAYGGSYSWIGENIAAGHRTPAAVVTGWMNSPGHRANILNENFNTIGVGVYVSDSGRLHWVQLFLRP